jgi:hypothetical protein
MNNLLSNIINQLLGTITDKEQESSVRIRTLDCLTELLLHEPFLEKITQVPNIIKVREVTLDRGNYKSLNANAKEFIPAKLPDSVLNSIDDLLN